jgi:hypothetical protein
MTAEYQDVLKTPLSTERVRSILLDYLNSNNIVYTIDDNRIMYTTGVSFFSWGERISVSIQGEIIKIKSKCKLRTQIQDWGKNKRNVRKLLRLFE